MENLLDLQLAMEETLHPDLVPYLEKGGILGKQLRHPLVYQVPLLVNGHANKFYKQKLKEIDDAIENNKWSSYVFLYERPYRIGAFHAITDKLDNKTYWEILGSIWTDTENSWQNINQWKTLFASKRGNRECLMDAEEFAKFKSFPETLTVYRGCQKGINENGLAWTLNKGKAEWFANRLDKKGIVLEKTISKSEIVAFFQGRQEEEVIL